MITKNLVKKCLEMLAVIGEENDDSKKRYEQLGKCLKLGVRKDSTNPTKEELECVAKELGERKTEEALKILRVIMKNLVKKCLEMFAETAEKKDDYK